MEYGEPRATLPELLVMLGTMVSGLAVANEDRVVHVLPAALVKTTSYRYE
jgi:sulfur carrier protein ThiS